MRPFVKTRSVWRSKWMLILIVLAAVVVRLIGIGQPFIDLWSWRQSDVAAIARNFLETGFHFSYPQIDWAGTAPGFVGTEFPILPFVAALCYKVTGVQEWVGRIQGVILFAAALPFFFLLVRRIFGEVVGIWATFFYAFAPLSVVASRAFMPDIPSLSLALVGTYFFVVWLEEKDRRALIVSALLFSLSFLIKMPTAVIGLPLFYLAITAWRDGRRFHSQGGALSKPPFGNGKSEDGGLESAAPWGDTLKRLFTSLQLWLFALIALVPSALWYWHAHGIAKTHYPYHFFGGGGFQIMNAGWYWKIADLTVRSSLTPMLSVLAIVGAFVTPRGKYTRIFHWWLAAMIAFIFFVGWGNRHQWYQLPLVPIAAVFAGCACQWVASRFQSRRALLAVASVLLAAFFVFSSHQSALPLIRPTAAGLRNLGLELREATTPTALIVAADEGDPTVFYYAHRKGWHFPEEGVYHGNPLDSAQLIANLEKLRDRGATHLVFYEGTSWWLKEYREFAERLASSATLVEETPEFTIFRLQPPSPPTPP